VGIYVYSGPFEWCLILGGWCGSTSYIHTYIYIHIQCVCVLRMRILDPHVCWLCADDQGWFFDGEVWWYCCLGPMSHQKTKSFKCCLICSEELFGFLTVCWLFHRVFFLFIFDKQIFLVHSQPGFVRRLEDGIPIGIAMSGLEPSPMNNEYMRGDSWRHTLW